jgi:hypothetical protein
MEALVTLLTALLALASDALTRAAVVPAATQLREAGYGPLADALLNAGGAKARAAVLARCIDVLSTDMDAEWQCCPGCGERIKGACDCYADTDTGDTTPQVLVNEATSKAGYSLGIVTKADRSCSTYEELEGGRQYQYDWVRADDRMFNVHPWNGSLAGVGGYGIRWEVNLDRGLDVLPKHEADGARALGFFPCDVPPPSGDSGPDSVGDGGSSTEDPTPNADAGTECAPDAPELRSVEAEESATEDNNCYLSESQEAAIRKDLRQWDGSTKEWGFRKSYPPRLRSTEHGRRTYFVWRMTRFHAGVDMRIPAMAMAIIDGDPAEAALDQLAGALAEQYFGTQLAAVATWVPLLGRPQ